MFQSYQPHVGYFQTNQQQQQNGNAGYIQTNHHQQQMIENGWASTLGYGGIITADNSRYHQPNRYHDEGRIIASKSYLFSKLKSSQRTRPQSTISIPSTGFSSVISRQSFSSTNDNVNNILCQYIHEEFDKQFNTEERKTAVPACTPSPKIREILRKRREMEASYNQSGSNRTTATQSTVNFSQSHTNGSLHLQQPTLNPVSHDNTSSYGFGFSGSQQVHCVPVTVMKATNMDPPATPPQFYPSSSVSTNQITPTTPLIQSGQASVFQTPHQLNVMGPPSSIINITQPQPSPVNTQLIRPCNYTTNQTIVNTTTPSQYHIPFASGLEAQNILNQSALQQVPLIVTTIPNVQHSQILSSGITVQAIQPSTPIGHVTPIITTTLGNIISPTQFSSGQPQVAPNISFVELRPAENTTANVPTENIPVVPEKTADPAVEEVSDTVSSNFTQEPNVPEPTKTTSPETKQKDQEEFNKTVRSMLREQLSFVHNIDENVTHVLTTKASKKYMERMYSKSWKNKSRNSHPIFLKRVFVLPKKTRKRKIKKQKKDISPPKTIDQFVAPSPIAKNGSKDQNVIEENTDCAVSSTNSAPPVYIFDRRNESDILEDDMLLKKLNCIDNPYHEYAWGSDFDHFGSSVGMTRDNPQENTDFCDLFKGIF